jgi:hypothetical protein
VEERCFVRLLKENEAEEWMKMRRSGTFSFRTLEHLNERFLFRHHRLTKIDYVWLAAERKTKEMTVKSDGSNTTIRHDDPTLRFRTNKALTEALDALFSSPSPRIPCFTL